MALTGVLRPGHVCIRVLEMEPALKHYKDVLGLIETARDEKTGRVFLKAWDEHDHHSIVLREADEAGMDYMGWRVDSPATLKKLAPRAEACGRSWGPDKKPERGRRAGSGPPRWGEPDRSCPDCGSPCRRQRSCPVLGWRADHEWRPDRSRRTRRKGSPPRSFAGLCSSSLRPQATDGSRSINLFIPIPHHVGPRRVVEGP